MPMRESAVGWATISTRQKALSVMYAFEIADDGRRTAVGGEKVPESTRATATIVVCGCLTSRSAVQPGANAALSTINAPIITCRRSALAAERFRDGGE